MSVEKIGHDFDFELANMCSLFFPGEKLAQNDSPFHIRSIVGKDQHGPYAVCEIIWEGRRYDGRFDAPTASKRDLEYAVCKSFYQAAVKLTGHHPKWGILTGIRPAKLARQLLEQGLSEEQVIARFQQEYFASPAAAKLCLETVRTAYPYYAHTGKRDASVYISVPFCPSRCAYCSFVSHSVEKARTLLSEYVPRLIEEVGDTAKLIRELGLRIHSIYVGGGTPTILDEAELGALIQAIGAGFDLDQVAEFTYESGRPETINEEKLRILSAGGVSRISINPQSMHDAVLAEIGRRHTAQQIRDAYRLARRVANFDINMDLIAGLPGDTAEGFADSLAQLLALRPENITVHTLAIKRAARLRKSGAYYDKEHLAAGRSVSAAHETLFAAGYSPYYLYKQKNTVANLENTSFCLPGKQGQYNIFMMDEIHSVLGIGAGAVSKLIDPQHNRIERVFHYKYPYEYLKRYPEVYTRKERVRQFYETL